MSDNLFRKVEKEKPKSSSKYQKYGFSRNPFPRHPGVIMNDPDDRQNGSIYFKELRQEEERQFEQILIPNNNRPETKTIAFLMDYATRKGRGIGKTAFLKHQKERIMSDLGLNLSNNTEILFAVYVAPIPNDNYRKFYNISKLILNSIIDQEILALAMCRIRVFTGLIDDKILDMVQDMNNIIETIGNDDWLREAYNKKKDQDKTFTKELDISALNYQVKRNLTDLGLDNELCARLSRFGYSRLEIYNYYFDKQPEFYWKKNASNLLFTDFVKIFELANFTHGIILFEEVEKIVVPMPASGRREFCESLRYYFIDGDASYNAQVSFFKTLLTIHPYLQELLNPHWDASGLGRFAALGEQTSQDFTVYFKPIDSSSAVPLAKTYIKKSLISQSELIAPFTDESLSLALTKTLGVPGKYLAFLHSVIEKGADEGWNEIAEKQINSLAFYDAPDEKNDDDDQLEDTHVKLK